VFSVLDEVNIFERYPLPYLAPLRMILIMDHPIRSYCVERNLRQREFAKTVGLSEGFISQLILGRERCGRDAALSIVEKTGGEIDLTELLTWKLQGTN